MNAADYLNIDRKIDTGEMLTDDSILDLVTETRPADQMSDNDEDDEPEEPNVKKIDARKGLAQVISFCEQNPITIHHECPCRIEISYPRGWNFNQGRGLPSPWLNSDPEGEISLSYMDRLMMDRFSPTFRSVFVRT